MSGNQNESAASRFRAQGGITSSESVNLGAANTDKGGDVDATTKPENT